MNADGRSSRNSSGGGPMDSSNVFNDFFYRGDAEKPPWMSLISHGSGNTSEDEEKLLDDVQSCYMSRSFSIDSSRVYSRTCSLESEESDYNENDIETEVVLRVAICCSKCENKVKSLTQMEGVTSVTCDRKIEKVTVTGTARPRDVLAACKKLFEQSTIWSPDDFIDNVP